MIPESDKYIRRTMLPTRKCYSLYIPASTAQSRKIPFWINDERDVFSSFDRARAGRNGMKCHPIEIECVTFDKLLTKYGVPYYLKLDAEGAEPYCLKCLQPISLPEYV